MCVCGGGGGLKVLSRAEFINSIFNLHRIVKIYVLVMLPPSLVLSISKPPYVAIRL